VTRSDEELEALGQLAADIRLLPLQSAAWGPTAAKLLEELIRHMTESLHLLMDRPDALQGTMPWWRADYANLGTRSTEDLGRVGQPAPTLWQLCW
jgi:hypothetical protein